MADLDVGQIAIADPIVVDDPAQQKMQLVPDVVSKPQLASKQLTSNSLPVTVQHNVLVVQSTHTIETVAVSGGSRATHRWTIGPEDGPRPAPPTVEELQTTLDQVRAETANTVTWKETVRVALGSLT